MNTPEEPRQPLNHQISYEVPYEQLPPNVKMAFDAAVEALGNDPLAGDVQAFTLRNDFSFNQTIQPEPRPQYWAKWEYNAEEWKQFDKLDWGRAISTFIFQSVLWVAGMVLPYGVIFVLPTLLLNGLNSTLSSLLWPLLLLFIVGLIFSAAFSGRPMLQARKRHIARKNGSRRVTIGNLSSFNNQGLWQADLFVPLQETFLTLKKVQMTENPPLLHLRRKHLEIRQSSWHDTVRVLVPQGYEAEAAQLVERFRAETVASTKKDHTPPEP